MSRSLFFISVFLLCLMASCGWAYAQQAQGPNTPPALGAARTQVDTLDANTPISVAGKSIRFTLRTNLPPPVCKDVNCVLPDKTERRQPNGVTRPRTGQQGAGK